jgi:cell surface protein SprA
MSKQKRDSLLSKTQDVIERQNLNFMNVRKDRLGAKGKPQLWDIENFDLSYAYSEISRHNIDIESDKKKTYRGGLGYNFMINPKNVKPLQRIIKGKSFQLISDFNFYYLPKLLSFRTDMLREYQRRMIRNKSEALIVLEPTYTKKWDWNRIYDLKYDLTQSLKLDYSANVNAYVNEPPGGYDKHDANYQAYKDSVKTSILGFGSMSRFNQNANLNYMLPFSKIPLLNFISGSARYGVMYRWEASPRSLQAKFGNTIENTNNYQLSGGVRMTTLYNKVGFLKKAITALQAEGQAGRGPGMPGKGKQPEAGDKNTKAKADPNKKGDDTGAGADTTDTKPKKDYLKIIGTQMLGVLMLVKDANITYNETNGILLPGFMPEAGPLGNNWKSDAPGLGFIMGSQRDISRIASDNGWLSADTLLNNPYIVRHTNTLTFRSQLEPIRNLKIEVNADRSYSSTNQSYYKANSQGEFKPTSQQERGTFSMSYILWPTAFQRDNKDDVSPVFEKMLEYRQTIAGRLAAENPNSVGLDSLGYPSGYGPTQPQVLMGAFLAAYAGRDPVKMSLSPFPKIPLPNWRITYNANQGIKFLRDYFQSFNISHAYRSSYSLGGFLSDIKYQETDGFASAIDAARNYIPSRRMDVISITEQFGPFLGIEATMKNSFMARIEYKKTRNLSLSFVNNQLTEVRSNEFVTGIGYRVKNVKFSVRSIGSNKKTPLKSDLNLKADVSIRDSKTILRRIEQNDNQISTGTMQISINTSADYMINQKLNVRLFYEQTISKPHVLAQIPTSTTNVGISLRFTLAQ